MMIKCYLNIIIVFIKRIYLFNNFDHKSFLYIHYNYISHMNTTYTQSPIHNWTNMFWGIKKLIGKKIFLIKQQPKLHKMFLIGCLKKFIVFEVMKCMLYIQLECGTYHHPRRLQCVLSRNQRIFRCNVNPRSSFGMSNPERQLWYLHLLTRHCSCNLFAEPTSPKHEYRWKLWGHPVTSSMT